MSETKNELSEQIIKALEDAGLTIELATQMPVEELVKIKGIGESSAKKILEYETPVDDGVDETAEEQKEKSKLDIEADKIEDAKNIESTFPIGDYEFEFRFLDRQTIEETRSICGAGSENDALADARYKADTYSNGRYTVVFTGKFKKVK